jgi:hypothetical protein
MGQRISDTFCPATDRPEAALALRAPAGERARRELRSALHRISSPDLMAGGEGFWHTTCQSGKRL